ncbi:MAG: MATE family efflux transporter [Lachnospiraceae bacterium]|nr:MATE family efflux transporter [Lachnospiraceae bacterium]
MKDSHTIDMCTGSLPKKMIRFAFPLILSSLLQLMFNAVDLVVVGQFVNDDAVGAVGSTGALINLIINLFMGLSVGTNVLTARYVGSGRDEDASETVHTSIVISILCGILLAFVGIIFARPMLVLMGSPNGVIEQATLYLRIYFLGMPIMMLYNFGSAILRAIGDTKRSLYYLTFSGVINVLMNLLFVIVLKRGVDGVAWGTVISQLLAAVLILRNLYRSEHCCRLIPSKLRISASKVKGIAQIGIPAGIQSCIFSASNVLIQSSINSFGNAAISGSAAAANIEGFVYVSMNAFHHTVLSFTGQNYGAGRYDRVRKTLFWGLIFVTVVGGVLGNLVVLLRVPLLNLYISGEEALSFGFTRIFMINTLYFLCGTMDVVVGSLRGMGFSLIPMFVSLAGVCGFRVIWIFTYFRAHHTLSILLVSYPISWLVTFAAHLLVYFLVARRKRLRAERI